MNRNQKRPIKVGAKTQNTQRQAEMEQENHTKAKVIEHLENWIQYVSQAQESLGGFSICPFAKRAVYKIIFCDIDEITPEENYDVILYVIKEDNLEIINNWVEKYNKKYPDWLFFEDCATYDTYIQDIKTNNGKYNLILGQPKDKLRKFRDILKKTDYYSYWSKEYYNEIMNSDLGS